MTLPLSQGRRPGMAQESVPDPRNKTISKAYCVAILARISLAALAAFVVYKGGSPVVLGALGILVSPPAVSMALGGFLVYKGTLAIISAVASGSLLTLVSGLILTPIGCTALLNGCKTPPGKGAMFSTAFL